MSKFVNSKNNCNADTVRLSDDELHNKACKYLWEGSHLIFGALPAIIRQIIENKIWQNSNKYNNFGEYALDQSITGLGISNNQMLWILKASMDVEGKNIAEWLDLLNEVDKSVRAYAKTYSMPIKNFRSVLFEKLGKGHADLDMTNVITYLPTRSKSKEAKLLRIRKNNLSTYKKVMSGKMKISDALAEKSKPRVKAVDRAKNIFSNLSSKEREVFLAWLDQQPSRS